MAKAKKRAGKKSASRSTARSTSRFDLLQELARKYQTCAEHEKELRTERAQISGELMEIMRALEAKKVEVGDVRISSVTTVREKLDEIKLLKAGVSAKTIAKCKTKSAPSYSVRVSELKTPRDSALIVSEYEESDVPF